MFFFASVFQKMTESNVYTTSAYKVTKQANKKRL